MFRLSGGKARHGAGRGEDACNIDAFRQLVDAAKGQSTRMRLARWRNGARGVDLAAQASCCR